MTTIDRTEEFVQAARLTPRISAFCKRCRSALQERRKRTRLRAALHALPDRILRDIGVSREDIEYLARNGTDERVDPREGRPRPDGYNGLFIGAPGGSTPPGSPNTTITCTRLAQSVERRPLKSEVRGSSPRSCTNLIGLRRIC
jgi:uncharacterized protein YjiS (DUF1127 family)